MPSIESAVPAFIGEEDRIPVGTVPKSGDSPSMDSAIRQLIAARNEGSSEEKPVEEKDPDKAAEDKPFADKEPKDAEEKHFDKEDVPVTKPVEEELAHSGHDRRTAVRLSASVAM
jgi:hypothetical protein